LQATQSVLSVLRRKPSAQSWQVVVEAHLIQKGMAIVHWELLRVARRRQSAMSIEK
jgi:hypothetical protein